MPPDEPESNAVNELFAAYPRIPKAIAYVETILCDKNEGHELSAWSMLMTHKHLQDGTEITPAVVVKLIVSLVIPEIAGMSISEERGILCQVFVECSDPQFLQYIAGKMGAL